MTISVPCDCGRTARVKQDLAGKAIKCPGCGKSLNVAGVKVEAPVPASAAGEEPPFRLLPSDPVSPVPSAPPVPRRAEGPPRRPRRKPRPPRPPRWPWAVAGAAVLIVAGGATALVIGLRSGKPAKSTPAHPATPEKPAAQTAAIAPLAPEGKAQPARPGDPRPARPPVPTPPAVTPLVGKPPAVTPPATPPPVKPAPPPPVKPPPLEPKPPVPAKNAVRVAVSRFGQARVSGGNLAGKPLTGVLLDFEALVPHHSVLFEAPTVTALDAKGNEIGSVVLFVAAGRENLGPEARIVANSACQRLDIAIGAQRFDTPPTGTYGRTVVEATNRKEFTGKTQPVGPGVQPMIGDIMAVLPLTSGGIEYTFLQNRKVRLGFLFPAKVEQVKKLKVLGQALVLEAAKQDRAVPRAPAPLPGPGGRGRVMRPPDFQPGPGGKVVEVYHYSSPRSFGTPSRNVKIYEQADGTRKTTALGRTSVIGFARTGFKEVTYGVDVLGSTGVRVVVNRKLGYTTVAGLRFKQDALVNLGYDGTVEVSRTGIKAEDETGEAYISRRLMLRGRPTIVMTRAKVVAGK